MSSYATRISSLAWLVVMTTMLILAGARPLHAACTSPAASVSSLNWNGTAWQYCDGTNWNNFGGGGASWGTVDGGTVTTSTPYIFQQTWNAGAVTFTGIKANFTSTASAAASLLVDLQVGGSSMLQIGKDLGYGLLFSKLTNLGGIITDITHGVADGGFISFQNNVVLGRGGTQSMIVDSGYAAMLNGNYFGFGPNTTGGNTDLFLRRAAAASLQLGNADAAAPVAQTLGVQSVVAGTTNTAGADFTIAGSKGTGTGAGGALVFKTAPAGSTGTAQNALAEALRITSAGNVGIGTSTVQLPLMVANYGSVSSDGEYCSGLAYYNAFFGMAAPGNSEAGNSIVMGPGCAGNNPMIRMKTSGGSMGYVGWAGNESYFYIGTGATNAHDFRIITNNTNRISVLGTNGFVGIGTTAPTALLHLSGNRSSVSWTTTGIALASDAATYTDTNSAAAATIATRAATSLGIPTYASTNAITVTNAANLYIAGAPAAGTNTTITNSNALYVAAGNSYFGGNVGIGTTNPQNQLSLGSGSSGLAIYNTADETTNFEKFQGAWSSNNYDMGLYAGGTAYFSRSMRIGLASWNGSPATLTSYLKFNAYNASDAVFDFAGATNGVAGSSFMRLGVNASNNSQIISASSGIQNILNIGMVISQTGTAGYNAVLINPTEGTTGSGTKNLIDAQVGGADRFTVSNTGQGYFAGNVGIGTTSPGAQLQINAGNAATKGQIIKAAASQTANLFEAQNSSGTALAVIDSTGAVTATSFTGSGSGLSSIPVTGLSATGSASSTTYLRGDGVWATPSSSSQWSNGAASAIYYNSGNVGIGTTSPQAMFHVGGVAMFTHSSSPTYGIKITPGSSGDNGSIGFDATPIFNFSGSALTSITYSPGSKLSFNIRSGSTAVTFDGSGNVGIGTTVPGTALDLNGAQTFRGMAAPSVSAAGQGIIYFDSTANVFKVSQNGGAYADLVNAGGSGNIQSAISQSATSGGACSTVGQLGKDVSGYLYICDGTPSTLDGAACATVGAFTLDVYGNIFACMK